ncbi:hypothetical protein GWK47_052325 [Chionoecetes opilio]|uniref:Uncharacterized protein n=1 Tax=Chionoecetes opilio TaxID=41210 RepID=A0A8J4Y867_CHIOP|nr:hypothetical protein GWK47_052325 [Chionoecetes opilio]
MGRTSSTRSKLGQHRASRCLLLTYSSYWCVNSGKACTQCGVISVRHSRERETPLPPTCPSRSRCYQDQVLIDYTCFSLEMRCHLIDSYSFTADIANGVCPRFNMEEVVSHPSCVRDCHHWGCRYIDHNPSATSQDSFHVTVSP